jgi:hypothetical protein
VRISAEYLDSPEPDAELAERMAREATMMASRRALDFSIDGLSALDVGLLEEDVEAVGAYVGEVLTRHAGNAVWARNRQGEPGVAVGNWLADPWEWVERVRSPKETAGLSEMVTDVLVFAESPNYQTAEQLGWQTKTSSNWDDLKQSLTSWRRSQRRP